MSLITWYQVVIDQASGGGGGLLTAAASLVGRGLPLTVSNDVLGATFTLDADITVTMAEGAGADTFTVTLVNLPDTSVGLLRSTNPSHGLRVTIHLGYFDEPSTRSGSSPVMTGRVTAIRTSIGPDGLSRTVLEGQEEAGYRLRKTPARISQAGPVARDAIVRQLASAAKVPLAPRSAVTGTLTALTVRATTALTALQEIAAQADVPLVVADGAVAIGPAVGTQRAPVRVDPDVNLVARGDDQADDPEVPPGTVRTSVEVTVLGHPGLRAGQVVTVTGVDNVPAGPLRAARVSHSFGTATGYICRLLLVAAKPGSRAGTSGGVQGVVDRWQQAIARHGEDHPAVDVGEVTAYQPGGQGKHLATLNYGQVPAPDVVAPSVVSPVQTDSPLSAAPIASPFAFHNVGLITPVYPGMRAVLTHNRGLVNDAIVSGWLWPESPRLAPPQNQAGDWWLALPTQLDGDGKPGGPGVNDLIDSGGRRTIQVKALHLVVGTAKLPGVGTRPAPQPDDDTIVIEHSGGATITVGADGGVTISTKNTPIKLTNGQVTLALDGSAVKVS
jgi:hypothetical protein